MRKVDHWGPEIEAGEAGRGVCGRSPGGWAGVGEGALRTAELDKLEECFRESSRLNSSPQNRSTYPRICKRDLFGKRIFSKLSKGP